MRSIFSYLLLLIHIDLDRNSDQLLELGRLGDKRLPQRIVVDQEMDGCPLSRCQL